MRNIIAFAFAFLSIAGSLHAADAKPNFVYILCDDLGYGDVQCLNPQGKIKTPSIDAVAKAGVIYTDAHSGSSVCSPTRYGILTGRYAWRSKLQSGVLGGLSPRLIEKDRTTVASFLKSQGYHTACIGKWHLGMDWVKKPGRPVTELGIEPEAQNWNVEYGEPIANGPNAVGFDYFYGISASLDMVPYTFIKNDRVLELPTVEKSFPMMLGQKRGMTRKGPAAPDFDANQVLPRCTEQAVAYLAERGQSPETPFFLYLPLASPHTPIVPNDPWQGKSGLNPYADFVMETDNAIGQVMAALEKAKLADNTLVVVTSDNGCSPQANYPELLAKDHNPSHVFRGTKADIFEGGHRVPMIVRWPERLKAGTTSDQLLCHTDFLATCAEILGEKLPDNAGEDSFSFLPSAKIPRQSIVHHSINGSFALRERNWKLCLGASSGGWSEPRPGNKKFAELARQQLYDLTADIGEKKNVVQDHPEIAKSLETQLEIIVKQGRSTPGAPQKNSVVVDIHKSK